MKQPSNPHKSVTQPFRVCRFCGHEAAPGKRTCGPCGVGYMVARGRIAPTPDPMPVVR